MKNERENSVTVLSDDELEKVVGGISDAAYASIKQELDVAVSNNDFDLFSSIVCQNTAVYGKSFLSNVASDYTATGYLNKTRYSELMADVVAYI